ncbi:hypothetical protein PCL_11288 [Purpureocillium lilacinum]|uniref:mRNA stability protein n=1 Tax=Purpureocillium lilacinum TaxID=33203 RepID=A0A2U3DPY0_PURLI|nr:hypothetical protein Purlil1_13385 [Purpureocillium lilacinum]PWI64317.1 hypothetical protein PCL_11288 [Purpureocillium lilacinum]
MQSYSRREPPNVRTMGYNASDPHFCRFNDTYCGMSASKDTKPHNEKELRLKHLYGRIPSKGDLLAHQLEGRKYFDSGDFSLSQAHKSSDAGAVKTGSEHPLREGVSHPFSAVPSSSNVNNISQQQEQGELEAGLVRSGSQLREVARQPPGELGEAEQVKKGH